MSFKLTLSAPAKINRCLLVGGPRDDGYHPVLTLIQHLTLADQLVLQKSPENDGVTLRIDGPFALQVHDDNLVLKAARALEAAQGEPLPTGVDVTLTKNIPFAAGLGGGSSDAATMLVGLNALSGWQVSIEELSSIAAGLGADVPAFLGPAAGWYGGIGTEFLGRARLNRQAVLLLKPDSTLSTPAMYRKLDAMRDEGTAPAASLPETFAPFTPSPSDMTALLDRNDLAAPALEELSVLGTWLDELRASDHVIAANVSGSGPTMYALCTSAEAAGELVAALSIPPAWHTLCHTVA